MTESPLLTYLVPVYNTEPYVLRCLLSILDQGLEDGEYEVIVVDDGSTDGSRELIEAFAKEHPQVRLMTQKNAGVSAARNRAIAGARGRYLQFVDSDDHLQPGQMASLLRQAIDEGLDVLVFNYECEDEQGNKLPASRNDNFEASPVTDGVTYLKGHSMTPYIWRFLINREYLNSGGWRFNESLIVCEDGALITHLLLNARRMVQSDAALYHYVQRGNSAMNNRNVEHLHRRIMSQVESASLIDETIKRHEAATGQQAPASVAGLRNVYLYFALTKALTCGFVKPTVERMRQSGLYPFPCVGPEANYYGRKWKLIHVLMMRPGLWNMLSWVYRTIKG